MAYRGKPDFADLPLPGDDPRYPPIPADERAQGVAEQARELMLEGRMRRTAGGYWGPNQPMPAGAEHHEPMPGPWPAHPATIAVVEGVRDVVEGIREKGMSLQWQWGRFLADNVTVNPASPSFTGSYLINRSPEPNNNRTRNWDVHVWAYESQTIVPFASSQVAPGKFTADGQTLGSRLRVRIAWGGASGGTFRDVDIAQGFRTSIRAPQVIVYLVYPQPANLQVNEGPLMMVGQGGGLVLNSLVGVLITESVTTVPSNVCTLSETFVVPAGTADFPVRVPAGTRAVSIYQTGAGVPFTMEWQLLRGIAGSPSIGEIILGPARRLDHVTRIGNAGQIVSGPADGVDRTVTFIWELDI